MNILIVGSEMAPLVKTGGLGDVLGALPGEFAKLGHQILTVIPNYRNQLGESSKSNSVNITGDILLAQSSIQYSIQEVKTSADTQQIYLVECDKYYGRKGLYVDPKTGNDFADNDVRFAFFSKAIIDLLQKVDWRPDIIHVHDWQTALVPVYLKTTEFSNPFFKRTKTVLTIHNMAYQGLFKSGRFGLLGLPVEFMKPLGPLEFFGQSNFLKAGILFADKITTVSETYAREIQENLGCGLEGVLKTRKSDLVGIINGVDYKIWSPSIDKNIKFRYSEINLSGKRKNKAELLKKAGLSSRNNAPLIGMITRLVEQKGIQLVIEGCEQLFALNLQLIILGSGDKLFERELINLERKYSKVLKVFLKFDEHLAHMIEAGSDIYLMPSQFEPCGLNQMYSLKYGTPPVVHKVGGLADTVSDYNELTGEGTGFVFEEFSVKSMMAALARAVNLYSKKRKWTKLMKNGMQQNFSWTNSAKKYVQLFESIIK